MMVVIVQDIGKSGGGHMNVVTVVFPEEHKKIKSDVVIRMVEIHMTIWGMETWSISIVFGVVVGIVGR